MNITIAVFRVIALPVIALMMKAASTSETSVNFYQNTRRNSPEDSHLLATLKYSEVLFQP
jgi:hypothetical protein